MSPNPYLLAADNNPDLLPLLRREPSLAASQDEHGYSLVHAAASYNHVNLLKSLIREFNVNVNLRDEDGETALFVVETVEAAKVLVEELQADIKAVGIDGLTASQKIEAEGDFPAVAAYLKEMEGRPQAGESPTAPTTASTGLPVVTDQLPTPPPGMTLRMGVMTESDDIPGEADPEFRRRIEELAARDDFQTPQGQADLRRLVEDALSGEDIAQDRNVRPRQS